MAILGVDVGGTFTDFFLLRDDGRVSVYKRPSTPDDSARGVLEGLAELLAQPAGDGPPAKPGGVGPPISNFQSPISGLDLVHGSTVATNAIIERRGARTALITTRGFRDVLLIGRQTRPRLYDLSPQRPPPLVPDDLRLEVSERLDHRGQALQPLDPAEVEALLDRLQESGIESLAVCFLFSFLNPHHEQIVAKAARRRGIPVSPSHEVLPEHREYERTSTTVANAYVAPVIARYLSRLHKRLEGRGVRRLRIMASNGGSVSARAAGRLAVRTVLSGPAGGVAGAFALARRAGLDHIITLDMGGTSTDVSLCPGRILERDETLIGDLPIRGATVDVVSVGAGGGSIARLDQGGALRVGPHSTGADPGPACYGRSDLPTVTDAQVILGRIDPQHFLGGRMLIESARSLQALRCLAAPFAGSAHRAAAAVLRVANTNMERALRLVSVERGHDPRLFTLVAFGGAGPLHACDLAEALRIPRVLVPPYPGVLSALGMAAASLVKDLSATAMLTLDTDAGATFRPALSEAEGSPAASPRAHQPKDHPRLAAIFDELRRRAEAELEAEGFPLPQGERGRVRVERFLEMRYLGQSYEISTPVEDLSAAHFLPRFHANHQQRYGHSDPSRPVEVVNARLKLTLPAPVILSEAKDLGAKDLARVPQKRAADPLIGRREVWFARPEDEPIPADTAVYDRSCLAPGFTFSGPAIVVQMDATTALPPGWQAEVDEMGNMILEPTHA